MEQKYNGDGAYLVTVNAKEVVQEMGKEQADTVPTE